MRKMLLGAVLLSTVALAFPATGGAEFSYGVAQVSFKDLLVTFNDDTKCGLHVSSYKQGSQAKSDARYYCYNAKKRPMKGLRVKMVNAAGEWLQFDRGKETKTYRTCKSYECSAPTATLNNVKSNARVTGNAVFHIYYGRQAAFFFALPPGCEYVQDPEGKGPPGHRVTCAIQSR